MDDDTFLTLAGRLAHLGHRLRREDRERIEAASGGLTLIDIAHRLKDATDIDRQIETAGVIYSTDAPTPEHIQEAERRLKYEAGDLLNPALRRLVIEIATRDEIVIDEVSQDRVIEAGFVPLATDDAEHAVQTFREFIEANRDEIMALQILYNMPYGSQRLQWAHIKELAQRLEAPPYRLNPEKLWAAFAKVEPEHVRMSETKRLLTDLIALVRHAIEPESDLIPYPEQVRARYDAWLEEQRASGRRFTAEQRAWLDAIADYIGVNLELDVSRFDETFKDRGGVLAAVEAFEDSAVLRALVDELNTRLAA